MLVEVACYKVNHSKATFTDKIIAWWTSQYFIHKLNGEWRGGFSHVGIIVNGVMYETSPTLGNLSKVDHDRDHEQWEYIKIHIPNGNIFHLVEFLESQLGKPYDWLGITGFVLPFINDDDKKWFCSEYVITGLQMVDVPRVKHLRPSRSSPNKLVWTLMEYM